jgi:hypothetical protein
MQRISVAEPLLNSLKDIQTLNNLREQVIGAGESIPPSIASDIQEIASKWTSICSNLSRVIPAPEIRSHTALEFYRYIEDIIQYIREIYDSFSGTFVHSALQLLATTTNKVTLDELALGALGVPGLSGFANELVGSQEVIKRIFPCIGKQRYPEIPDPGMINEEYKRVISANQADSWPAWKKDIFSPSFLSANPDQSGFFIDSQNTTALCVTIDGVIGPGAMPVFTAVASLGSGGVFFANNVAIGVFNTFRVFYPGDYTFSVSTVDAAGYWDSTTMTSTAAVALADGPSIWGLNIFRNGATLLPAPVPLVFSDSVAQITLPSILAGDLITMHATAADAGLRKFMIQIPRFYPRVDDALLTGDISDHDILMGVTPTSLITTQVQPYFRYARLYEQFLLDRGQLAQSVLTGLYAFWAAQIGAPWTTYFPITASLWTVDNWINGLKGINLPQIRPAFSTMRSIIRNMIFISAHDVNWAQR